MMNSDARPVLSPVIDKEHMSELSNMGAAETIVDGKASRKVIGEVITIVKPKNNVLASIIRKAIAPGELAHKIPTNCTTMDAAVSKTLITD